MVKAEITITANIDPMLLMQLMEAETLQEIDEALGDIDRHLTVSAAAQYLELRAASKDPQY